MKITNLSLMLVCLMAVTAATVENKEAKVTPLFSKHLPEAPGKEGMMITVEYPPGSVDPIHRHNAHGFFMCWKAQSSCRCGAAKRSL